MSNRPKFGYASTAASPSQGTDVGLHHRLSDNIPQAHRSRDINYGKVRASFLEKGFFTQDRVKFDPGYSNHQTISYGRAKINDEYDNYNPKSIFNLKGGHKYTGRKPGKRRKDILDHYKYVNLGFLYYIVLICLME